MARAEAEVTVSVRLKLDDESTAALEKLGWISPEARVGRPTAAQLAERFHEAYERLAPEHGYETRKTSAVPWAEVPERNRALMTAVCAEILTVIGAGTPVSPQPEGNDSGVSGG